MDHGKHTTDSEVKGYKGPRIAQNMFTASYGYFIQGDKRKFQA